MVLTNLQIELLKTFAYSLPEEQIQEIRSLLADYFLTKMDVELERLSQENQWDEQTFEGWANEHNRSPYSPGPHANRP
ncbi:hypothetical protein GCM10023187_44350 [Nibrella viscosa]|uniref:Dephospho-CoA kinase n=1 Tax=Nibrella viscosa TaxID=1084524 RepID=A0ABP8KRP3_9BACT